MRSGSILIVEDDEAFAAALSEALIDQGFTVVHSSRPSEALIKLKNQRFSCVLLDIGLQGFSGLKVIQSMRAPNMLALNVETPIIVMSGQLQTEMVKTAAGKVQGMLAKPFELKTLFSKIEEVTAKAA